MNIFIICVQSLFFKYVCACYLISAIIINLRSFPYIIWFTKVIGQHHLSFAYTHTHTHTYTQHTHILLTLCACISNVQTTQESYVLIILPKLLVFLPTEEFRIEIVKCQEIQIVPIVILRVTFSATGCDVPYNCECYKCRIALVLSR